MKNFLSKNDIVFILRLNSLKLSAFASSVVFSFFLVCSFFLVFCHTIMQEHIALDPTLLSMAWCSRTKEEGLPQTSLRPAHTTQRTGWWWTKFVHRTRSSSATPSASHCATSTFASNVPTVDLALFSMQQTISHSIASDAWEAPKWGVMTLACAMGQMRSRSSKARVSWPVLSLRYESFCSFFCFTIVAYNCAHTCEFLNYAPSFLLFLLSTRALSLFARIFSIHFSYNYYESESNAEYFDLDLKGAAATASATTSRCGASSRCWSTQSNEQRVKVPSPPRQPIHELATHVLVILARCHTTAMTRARNLKHNIASKNHHFAKRNMWAPFNFPSKNRTTSKRVKYFPPKERHSIFK